MHNTLDGWDFACYEEIVLIVPWVVYKTPHGFLISLAVAPSAQYQETVATLALVGKRGFIVERPVIDNNFQTWRGAENGGYHRSGELRLKDDTVGP